jgi:RHS repeat-associated protein
MVLWQERNADFRFVPKFALGWMALMFCSLSALAGTFTAFGPQTYVRGKGEPVIVSNSFPVLNPNTQYTLRVEARRLDEDKDLDSDEGDPRARARITLNGKQVVDFDDFRERDHERRDGADILLVIEKPVQPLQSNVIAVQVKGKRATAIIVSIIGVDNDLPLISGSSNPPANNFGWNNSTVIVAFTCADKTSGVASCTSPVTLNAEGANQMVNGTAVDRAGNTSSTSVSVNIDETAPTIVASASPAPNSAGWNNTDVTVTFTCADSLSGVASCPAATTISSEGANQTISGTATDKAGNNASTTSPAVNLDKTAPVITITSPINGVIVGTPTLTLTGMAIDALSGTDSVTCNSSAALLQGNAFSCALTLTAGLNNITVTATDVAGNTRTQAIMVTFSGTPVILDFKPKSASIGTLISVHGLSFISPSGAGPSVTLNSHGGGTINAPVDSFTATDISFVIPDGAASGPVTVTSGNQSTTSTATLTIVAPNNFSLTVGPSSASLIQGQSINFAVTLNSSNGFNQLAALSVSGLPAGVTSQYIPPQITAGQTALLVLTAPAGQTPGPATLTISASATVSGIALTQSATVSLNVQPVATSFMGRASVDDGPQTPLAGVKVTFMGQDGMGGTTTCTGETQSDEAGNFSFTNLGTNCVGEQLVRYDSTAATTAKDRAAGTSPPPVYAGVDLLYDIKANQVTTPPNVIRLPRIDDKETVMVQQNAAQDQTFTFKTIPNLSVTVYAGTAFSLADGSQPNPFPLTAVDVPIDRLPDEMPSTGDNTINPFIVAFQPANAVASQPVAVSFPNTLNKTPGTNLVLDTLNPTIGMMVKYGTGTVSNNGAQVVPDLDPAHPNHRYGLVHFDWHGARAQTPNENDPGPGSQCPPGADPGDCTCPTCGSKPVDVSSGLEVLTNTDIKISGGRGSIGIVRTYRTMTSNPGPFGIGTNHNYGYQLNTANFLQGLGVINLVMPDGNQLPFNRQPDGSFTNTNIPTLRGAVLAVPSQGIYNIRWKDGTVYQFQPASRGGPLVAFLTSITDLNGNTISLTLDSVGRTTQVTDPVGRSLALAYDGAGRITTITDPIGRSVQYSYNGQGTLATFTDAIGGVTQYAYDSQNRLTQITDPRGVIAEQFAYDATGRVSQAVEADGGVFKLAYTFVGFDVNQTMLLKTVVTDPLGNQTTYRFNIFRLVTDVIDPSGQVRSFLRDSGISNKIQGIVGTGSCSVCGDTRRGDQHFTHDVNGNILTSTDALGNTTLFTYEPIFNKVASITDPLGNVSTFTYDAHGNLLTSTDANNHTTSFAYNAFGQVTQIKDAIGQKTTLAYDNFGNPISTTDPLGNTTSVVYDAISRPVQTIDALGRKSQAVYDASNRVTKEINAQGNVTQFVYDANSNLVSITDASGHTTSFAYDPMNRLLLRTDPLGNSDLRTYDLNGNLVQFVDRRGQPSKFAYDVLNRLVESDYQDSTVTQSYDALGRLVHVNDSASGSFDFGYDSAGQLLQTVNPIGTVEYAHDADGRTTARQVTGQSTLQYFYDPVGNLLSATLPQASATFAYDALNRVIRIDRANGVNSKYRYDPARRLLSLVHSGPAGFLNTQAYTYDAVGNRTSYSTNIAQSLVTQPVSNQYDAGNRLIQSNSQTSSTAYAYDASGNLASSHGPSGNARFSWDSRDRLQSLTGSNGQVNAFIYDFGRNLIAQSDSGPTSNLRKDFVLDNFTDIAYLGQSNGDNLSVLAGQATDSHLAVVHSAGQIEYGVTDAINSTLATVDQAGEQISSVFYEPFGQTTTNRQPYAFQFTGRVLVGEGLYYYRSRYYDSATNRFISEDPLGLSDSRSNLYTYASNRPTMTTDPSGLCPQYTTFEPGKGCAPWEEGVEAELFPWDLILPGLADFKELLTGCKGMWYFLLEIYEYKDYWFPALQYLASPPPPYPLPPTTASAPQYTPPYISGGNGTANVPPQLPENFQVQPFQYPPPPAVSGGNGTNSSAACGAGTGRDCHLVQSPKY